MSDKHTAELARRHACKIAKNLAVYGLKADEPFPSGNVEGGWVIEAVAPSGFTLNVEVVGGPWEDDGTYEDEE